MSRDFKATTICSPKLSMYVTLPFMALRKEFVKCEATLSDDTLKDLIYHVDYDISGSVITFNEESMEDVQMIRVYRDTPTEYLLTQYVDSSVLKAYDMNVRDVQMLHILEEAYDFMLWYGMLFDYNSQTWNAKMGRIVSVGTPTDTTDATNKRYVDEADDAIKQYIQDYCLLFDEDMDAWDARNKSIAKVAEPTRDTDATTKHYVDDKINALNTALRQYIAEVRAALQEAINALTERVATNEQAIAQLKARMTTAEENITAIQGVLNQHAAAISANTQGINANTSAIEAIQQTLAEMQNTIEHLPSGGGGSIGDIEELKQEILDSLYVPVAKPTIRNIQHYDYSWSEQWNVELDNYNYDAISIQGEQYSETPGWHTLICTLKPLYKWEDGTTAPYELRWYAESDKQVISLDRVVTDGPNEDCRATLEMNDLTGNIEYQWNGDASSPANAPIKTFYFNFSKPYTKLCTEGMGETHEEGDTFYFNAMDENGNQNPIYQITVGHNWVRIEGNGYNSNSPESINVICDNDMNSKFVISFTASGWVQEVVVPKIQLSSITANTDETEHEMVSESPYSLILDRTSTSWSSAKRQTLKFAISEPYTTLKVKDNATGVTASEDGNTQLDVVQMYQGESVPRMIVTVQHDSITINGLGYNSDISKSFTVYTDDDEENGFVVTVTETRNFPELIGTDGTPTMATGDPWYYTDYNANMRYRYPRMNRWNPSDNEIASFIANGTLTRDNLILQGNYCIDEKSDSGEYTFTLTPAEGYVWAYDLSRTPKSYTWTHERTRDNVAAPTLTLAEEHSMRGNTPALYYGGPDVVLSYDTESDGEIEVEVIDNPRNAREKRYPEYTVDPVNKTISVRLTKTSRYEIEENAGRDDLGYSSFRGYAATSTYIRVRTKQSARCNASSQSSFDVYFAPGAYVDYETRTNSNAAYLNGTQTVVLSQMHDGCTIETGTDRANTVGEHILRATLNDGVDAWWDGSTERTREFTWTLHKTCPLTNLGFHGFASNTIKPYHGYNVAGVLTLSRGNVVSPTPTFSVFQGPSADAFEVTPIDNWGDKSQPTFKVVNKNTEAYEALYGIFLKVDFAEGENTSAFTKYINISSKLMAKGDAGAISTTWSSLRLDTGAKTLDTAAYITHGEIPSLADVSVVVEDTSIVTVEKVNLAPFYNDGVTTFYKLGLKFTPKAIGTTNITVTVPETTHYRALTITKQFSVN